jgi:hypothetical protein
MQTVWAAMLLLVAAVWWINGNAAFGAGLVAGLLAYAGAIAALSRRRRWAWWLCIAAPLVSLGLASPGVIYNLWRASQNDPLFSDSPGTLIVVLITALVLVIPPILILLRLIRVRSELSPGNSLE